MNRPDKDEYWVGVAEAVSRRATCCRRKVGAVLIRNGRIVSTGYNGAPEGEPHCLDVGCEIVNGHCVRCVHAEANALIQAGLDGNVTEGSTLYTTASPCRGCMGLIINAGISRIVYVEPYKDALHDGDQSRWALEAAERLGIEMVWIKGTGE